MILTFTTYLLIALTVVLIAFTVLGVAHLTIHKGSFNDFHGYVLLGWFTLLFVGWGLVGACVSAGSCNRSFSAKVFKTDERLTITSLELDVPIIITDHISYMYLATNTTVTVVQHGVYNMYRSTNWLRQSIYK